jgi:hypothetical protein
MTAFMVVISSAAISGGQTWNSNGRTAPSAPLSTASTSRDLSGMWDPGTKGVSPDGRPTAPLTPWGTQAAAAHKPTSGPRQVPSGDANDPLNTLCAPSGFPRLVLFEFRPFQIVQTPNQVLMLYMFERRWRVIWTDGRPLPKEPDPRWYGYSVGTWQDDSTFVVQTIGLDEKTWLDNAGNPHSDQLVVEERYHRTAANAMELTVRITDPKAYTMPWTPLDKFPLRRLNGDTDLMEMICSPEELQEYKSLIATPSSAPAR